MLHAFSDGIRTERGEAKSSTSTLQRRNHFAHVVSNQTKPSVFGVLFDYPPQRELRIFRHRVALVQNDQFEPLAAEPHSAGEGLDLIAHHVDAAI
tara:strand:- start:597 stop:881 length:285 start_codon:yes stop_codon:yes gene_type:complete